MSLQFAELPRHGIEHCGCSYLHGLVGKQTWKTKHDATLKQCTLKKEQSSKRTRQPSC